MKISWKWLGQWVDLSGLTPDEVAERLTLAGLEGEGIERVGQGCDNIVVARIDAIEEHPKADKLVVCRVDVGDGRQRQIVCGAKNMKAGDLVPAALPGSQPPTLDFQIGERKMMGTLSEGMLCSEDELGISAERAEGLLILPQSYEIGQPIFDALGLKDTLLEIGLTPNRPDCLCHRGVAREVSALYKRPLNARIESTRTPAWVGTGAAEANALCALSVEDAQGCPRYAFAAIEGVKVGPSPKWLKDAVVGLGLRSINNIVDVTNYVLMDVGQPLHAFDLDKLEGATIKVRRARAGESFRGLDHKDYTLDEADLVISDAARPVALAGVMGGELTEVTQETTRVLIECAYFDPTTVRKSARRHGLHTDSSHRFERGIDPAAIVLNLQRAVELILKTQEGLEGAAPVVAEGIGLVQVDAQAPVVVELPFGLTNKVLGSELSQDQVCQVLDALGFVCVCEDGHHHVTVPTYRPDVERPIDLVEEVARIVGFDQIKSRLPASVMGVKHERLDEAAHPETILSSGRLWRVRQVRELLMGHGLYEILGYSFMGKEQLDALLVPEDHSLRAKAVPVANPMNPEQAFMRTTLATGMLNVIKHNWAQRERDLALFEVGRCYFNDGEELALSLGLVGQSQEHWSGKRAWDFYDVKGFAEAIGELLGVEGARWIKPDQAQQSSFLHPGVQAIWVSADGVELGWIGQLHPAIAQAEELDGAVLLGQLWIERILKMTTPALGQYKRVSRYPAVSRDFALLVDKQMPYALLEGALEALRQRDALVGELFESSRVFDVYSGDRIEAGKRSIALEVVLRAADRTLSDEEISRLHGALIEALTSTGAQLR